MNINENTLNELITRYADDKEILDIIYNTVTAIEEYHSAILKMEAWMKVYSYNSVDKDEYQQNITDMDKRRTMCHNSVLSSVNILNRLAAKENLPLLYDSIVSEERPYRTEVADAVLEYIEDIIKKRR